MQKKSDDGETRPVSPSGTPPRQDELGRYPRPSSLEDFRRNLAAVQARIDAACRRVKRDPASVGLLPVRQCFIRLRTLRDQLRQSAPVGTCLDELSMGMSGDFEIAIEEGATVVRVGQAIYGARALPNSHFWPSETNTRESS